MADDRIRCPGCGVAFKGARGLRAHQSGRFVSMDCRPRVLAPATVIIRTYWNPEGAPNG